MWKPGSRKKMIPASTAGPVWGGHGIRGNCAPYPGNTTLRMSSLGHRHWIPASTAGPVWGGLECATVILTGGIPYFACRVWITDTGFQHQLRDQSGEAWNAQLSSLPGEYHTLHVEFGSQTLDSSINCGTSLGRPGMRNCHPYRGNTILCMSSLDHRHWIPASTAGPVWGGLECATVILTGGIPYFACRVWITDTGFQHQLRDQSGEAWNAQLSSLPGEYHTLHVEFGSQTLDSSINCGTSLGRPGMRNCHPYRGNTILCMSSLDHRHWIPASTAGPVWGGLECATVILTGGIPYFACRVWITDTGFQHQLRDQSGEPRPPQLCSLPREYHTLHVEFGSQTLDSSINCGTSLGSRRPPQLCSLPREVCVVRYVCVCVFCILCVPCYVMCCARCVKLHDV